MVTIVPNTAPRTPPKSSKAALFNGFKLSPPPRGLQRLVSQRSYLSTSTCTNSTSPKKPPTKQVQSSRRVRFEVDSGNKIKTHLHVYIVPKDTDFNEVYYSMDDMKRLKQNAKNEAAKFATFHPEYVDSLECLFESPLKNRYSRGSYLSPKEAAQTLRNQNDSFETPQGLEMFMCTELILDYREWAISSTLQLHQNLRLDHAMSKAKLKSKNTGRNPDDLLCKWCEKVNYGSKKFALQLAERDEMGARKAYRERLLS